MIKKRMAVFFPGRRSHKTPLSVLKRYFIIFYVNVGYFMLDLYVKIEYLNYMFRSLVIFVLRVSLIVALWVSIWKFIDPKTQLMRVLRAALLVLGLLVILAVLKITGQ